jgi:AcrR family transcriptional regulator
MGTDKTRTPRQDEILERSFELVREAGLAGLTMKKVAERVGFTEPALYRHFPTKQALVLALAEGLGARLLGPVRAIAGERDVPAAVRLERILVHHLSLVSDTGGLPFLLIAEASASSDETLARTMGGFARQHLEILTRVIAELPLGPEAPPARHLALPIMGLVAALAIQPRLVPEAGIDRSEAIALAKFLVRRISGRISGEEEPA